jgi:hypothetical protein
MVDKITQLAHPSDPLVRMPRLVQQPHLAASIVLKGCSEVVESLVEHISTRLGRWLEDLPLQVGCKFTIRFSPSPKFGARTKRA